MGLRQHDEAIAAFRQQIDVNPYDQYAHNLLGHALMTARRYDEAEAAFKKQVEINPLDRYAAASLGTVYLEQRKYDAALESFEKAVTLNPDDASLQVQLGKAHLHLNQKPQAVAAFDRAVELAPNPTTWNNVAYELALEGVHLDRALQYADSAVASATAASRNLELTRLDAPSLDVVSSLGHYWDTLGWVHYARGDLARAERLVDASWRLQQVAEVGDHLAQIYEKSGRTDEAITTYAMALASEGASDETRERLAQLLGDPSKVEDTVKAHREALTKTRTLRVPSSATRAAASADFFVLFSSTGGVEGATFVDGDERLRPMADAIRQASFDRMFPDETPTKLLRRGTLACEPQESECTFTLLLPRDTDPVK
jgi:tetratricopeptide (TPR) repeat protein